MSFRESILIPKQSFFQLLGSNARKGKGEPTQRKRLIAKEPKKKKSLLNRTVIHRRERALKRKHGSFFTPDASLPPAVVTTEGMAIYPPDERHITQFFQQIDKNTIYRIIKVLREHPELISWDDNSFQVSFRGQVHGGSHLIDMLTHITTPMDADDHQILMGKLDHVKVGRIVYPMPSGFVKFFEVLDQVLPAGAGSIGMDPHKVQLLNVIQRSRERQARLDDQMKALDEDTQKILEDIKKREEKRESDRILKQVQQQELEKKRQKQVAVDKNRRRGFYGALPRSPADVAAERERKDRIQKFRKHITKVKKLEQIMENSLRKINLAIAIRWKNGGRIAPIGNVKKQSDIKRAVQHEYDKAIIESENTPEEATKLANEEKDRLLKQWRDETEAMHKENIDKHWTNMMPRLPKRPDGTPVLPTGLTPDEIASVERQIGTPRAERRVAPRTLTYGEDDGAGASETGAADDDSGASARPRGKSVSEQLKETVWDQLDYEQMVAEEKKKQQEKKKSE